MVDQQQQQQQRHQEQQQQHIKAEPDVVEVKEELRDPLDTSNYSFSETNAIQANGIRECFVNVSQISNSSCDYSMSQFRADESAFSIKGMTGFRYDDDSRDIGDYDQGDNANGDDGGGDDGNANGDESDEDMPIAKRKKIKREISDDDDDEDLPLTARKKPKTEAKKAKKIKREPSDDEEDDDDYDKPKKKKIKKEKVRFAFLSRFQGLFSSNQNSNFRFFFNVFFSCFVYSFRI